MHLPYMQIANEVIDVTAPEVSAELEWDEAQAALGIIRMLRWALRRCPGNAPPSAHDIVRGPHAARLIAKEAGYGGNHDAFVDACCNSSFPVLQRVEGGIRFRGLDRYDAPWRKNNKEAAAAWDAAHDEPPPEPARLPEPAPPESGRKAEPVPPESGTAPAGIRPESDRQMQMHIQTQKQKQKQIQKQGESPRAHASANGSGEYQDRLAAIHLEELRQEMPPWGQAEDDASRELTRLSRGDDELVFAQWRRALRHEGYPTCRSLTHLAKFWGYYGPEPARDRRKAAIRAEDIPKSAFATVGDITHEL